MKLEEVMLSDTNWAQKDPYGMILSGRVLHEMLRVVKWIERESRRVVAMVYEAREMELVFNRYGVPVRKMKEFSR